MWLYSGMALCRYDFAISVAKTFDVHLRFLPFYHSVASLRCIEFAISVEKIGGIFLGPPELTNRAEALTFLHWTCWRKLLQTCRPARVQHLRFRNFAHSLAQHMHGREAGQAQRLAGIEFEDVPNRDMIDLETTEQKRDNFTYIADKFVKIAIRLLGFTWPIVRCWLSGGSGFERFELKSFSEQKFDWVASKTQNMFRYRPKPSMVLMK